MPSTPSPTALATPATPAMPAVPQGFSHPWRERLPLPPMEAMTADQRQAAEALIAGPRKAVFGPFVPLLRSPQLLDKVAKLGEYLRFGSLLSDRVRELTISAAARHAGNQFEWMMHAPLAIKAGAAPATLEALRAGARPKDLPADEAAALDFATELLHNNGVSEPTYEAALNLFTDQGVVELTTLIGYFVMVSWVMNVAHTPALQGAQGEPLPAFPQ